MSHRNGGGESVRLPRHIVNHILEHVQSEPGREVCGLVAASSGRPTRCFPVPNVAADPARRFEMEPAAQIAALRAMRETGESLFAIYHSHPSGPARPSATDLAEAAYPEALQLIVSLDTRGVLEMRAYRIRKGQATEVALEL